ncbi:undecaprenyldiphospho-muramoylpentapeptide beta-N-acetylglucosaminyltransferase [Kangiella sp. TOML190]|uniref:undecaprenyldiphospho-muramoylpentapeptide beta-N-acetylglucosaminyltransferase n=1 Tax=Kangiella sp. TOML190 TaxID=2931351 RepID=UPI002040D7C3|nr:undecaprenyldiphospho-muramoylpentapeptide beta-N-acetylglucosaminyltransferase [Kangiella sp. TOML190]
MSKTILLMAGGTGGHIFPALAVGHYLQNQGWNLHWLGSEGGMEETIVSNHGIKISLLPVKGIRGKGLVSLLKAPFTIASNVMAAKKIIKQVKPDVVLGMGGFASGPGGLAAKLCGIPVVIHEQNAIAGMTNKLLHKVSKFTLQAYPGAFGNAKKVVTTGNPVRKDIYEKAKQSLPSAEEGKVNLLVVGGSLGAQVFNQKVPETLNIVNHGLLIDVKHQSGRGKAAEVEAAYQAATNERLTFEVLEFIEDMAATYEWADLVICRAGALTVAEVAMAGRAAVFVPFPHAVDDHQTHNARYLADQGAAVIIQQHDLSPQRLAEQITALANNKKHLVEMAQKAQSLAMPNATQEVADYCIQAAGVSSKSDGAQGEEV